MESRGSELIERYKKNYAISPQTVITEQMILAHWQLEKQLTRELIDSTPENRWEVFDRCYSRLYRELNWLNRSFDETQGIQSSERYEVWKEVIGKPPLSVYEIGSGEARLLTFLAKCGFCCKGTDITRERGEKHQTVSIPTLSWGLSDGIHLDRFEPPGTYDTVISSQVLEHFHPDDLDEHLKSVSSILRPKGRYIFTTPHCLTGPHDISKVFKCEYPQGMHLKEYTYRELIDRLHQVGFKSIYHAGLPQKLRRILTSLGVNKQKQMIVIGKIYLKLVMMIEGLLILIPGYRFRYFLSINLNKIRLFNSTIFLVAQK